MSYSLCFQTAPIQTEALRELKNQVHFAIAMGLSMTTVQRMFAASLVAALGTWYLRNDLMDGMLMLCGLSVLTAMIWGLSERETTTAALNLDSSGVLAKFGVALSIVVFAQVTVAVWEFPTVGAYVLSLAFIGSFWLTGFMIQPE